MDVCQSLLKNGCRHPRRVAILVAAALHLASGGMDARAQEPAPSREGIVAEIARLGDPDYQVRECATRRLREWGGRARDDVFASLPVRDPDPEIRARCERIRAEIRRDDRVRAGVRVAGDDPSARLLVEKLIARPNREDLHRFMERPVDGAPADVVLVALGCAEDWTDEPGG